jgi:hypothetical protein
MSPVLVSAAGYTSTGGGSLAGIVETCLRRPHLCAGRGIAATRQKLALAWVALFGVALPFFFSFLDTDMDATISNWNSRLYILFAACPKKLWTGV